MNNLFIMLFSLLFLQSQDKIDLTMLNRIMLEATSSARSELDNIVWNLTDVLGPRLTNSPGGRKANKWAVNKLKEMGIQNAHEEIWGKFGKSWSPIRHSLEMISPYYEHMIAYPSAWSASTDGEIEGVPVLLDINDEADIERYRGKLKDKIVMIKEDLNYPSLSEAESRRYSQQDLANIQDLFYDPDFYGDLSATAKLYRTELRSGLSIFFRLRAKIRDMIETEGVAAVLSVSRKSNRGTVFNSNGASYQANSKNEAPELELLKEHYHKIQRLIERGIDVRLRLRSDCKIDTNNTDASNVVAEIKGAGKLADELVITGAHIDSWHTATGATDNAAGTAVMMDVMRTLNAIGMSDRNRRTIRLVLWTGEEQGLYGSIHYVSKHFADYTDMKLKPEHEKVSAYYNLDNGSGRIRGIYVGRNLAVVPIFKKFLEPFETIKANTISLNWTGSTDHVSFNAVGIPGFQFIQDELEYDTRTHHSNMDSYERLDIGDLKQAVLIIAGFVYQTAIRPEKLPRKPLPKARKRFSDFKR
ncbi:MAG: M20/M25/M40 family metallo-hydrolase [Calditrichaeota bacterium]|nr:M20/M25/M40 family metallo-hydrolase [Calditrichota bacterium]